jgi:hypothetical protein
VLIIEFEWSDEIEAHLARHGIVKADLDAMLGSRITFRKNKRSGSGAYQLLGRGLGGRPIRLVVAFTGTTGLWRPVTGRLE